MSILKRKTTTHESQVETADGIVTITAMFETVGRTGAWKRQDYRNDARKMIMGDENGIPEDRDEFRSYFFHMYEAANIFGAMVGVDINGEPVTEDWIEFFEEVPDPIIEEWLGEVYALNPQWAPKRDDEKN